MNMIPHEFPLVELSFKRHGTVNDEIQGLIELTKLILYLNVYESILILSVFVKQLTHFSASCSLVCANLLLVAISWANMYLYTE